MSGEGKTYKALFDNVVYLSKVNVSIAHIERLCAILDKQDEEFQHLKKQIGELETRIERMEKSFGGESVKKRYCFENGVSRR